MKLNCVISDTTLGGHKTLFGLLREQNTGDERHIFIVPDRYTLGVERDICETLYPDGAFNVDVCSFTRLAQKALGKKNKACLSKEGTVLLLNRIISENEEKLIYYKNVKSVAFSREMFATIASLRSSGISYDDLIERGARIKGSVGEKIKDISVLYKAYEEAIKGQYFDTITRVDWLINNLHSSDYVKNSHIYILGFNVFSNKQLDFIKRAMIVCPTVSIAFCSGRNNPNAECYPYKQREMLIEYCLNSGIEIEERQNTEILPRTFDFLHRELFAFDNKTYPYAINDDVSVNGYANVYEEVKAVAREIYFLTRNKGLRYKDFAVVCNNPKINGIIRKTFTRYGISFFIDEKYAVGNGFFPKFIKSIFSTVDSGFSKKELMVVLRHPYSGFSREEAQKFENYCLKYNIDYSIFEKPFIFDEECKRESVEAVRQKIIKRLNEVPPKSTAKAYCELIELWAGEQFINEKEQELLQGEKEEQIYSDKQKFLGVIGEIKTLCGEREFTVGEYLDMLNSVMENMTISVLPQYLDSVFVGNTSESRFNDVKVMFIIGANDGYFPVTTGDKLILGCFDTETMRRNGLVVFPSPEETNFFEQFALIDLVSKPEKLYLTYSKSAVDGSLLSEGNGVREIKYRLCLTEKPFIEKHGFNNHEKILYALATPDNAYFEYTAGSIPIQYKDGVKKFLISNGLLTDITVDTDKADLLKGYSKTKNNEYRLSVSKMETYFQCPYKHFLKNVLMLSEREEGPLKANDKGIIIHGVLEKYFYIGKKLREMTVKQREDYAERCISEVFENYDKRGFDSYQSKKELAGIKSECRTALKALTENMLHSTYSPMYVEKRFGEGGEISFSVGDKKFVFVGVIDRVDADGNKIIVIDYKTGKIEEDLKAVYMGEKIQLYLYLSYFLKKGLIPVGLFYLPLSDGYEKKAPTFAMRGQFINDIEEFKRIDSRVLDIKNGKFSSPNINFSTNIKSDGMEFANKNRKNLIFSNDFENISEYVLRLCKKATEEIIEGVADKKPLQGACEYCPYIKICGEVSKREPVNVDLSSFMADTQIDKDGEIDEVE